MSKENHPRQIAMMAASDVCRHLKSATTRLICAGSLRRQKAEVGDVEIVYIPRWKELSAIDLFGQERDNMNLADVAIERMLSEQVIDKRRFGGDSVRWGAKNKFAVHLATGIGIDLFSTVESSWFNYVVCRTGGAATNQRIAIAAMKRGWRWNPYGCGFTDQSGNVVPVSSERDVFELVGLKYIDPEDRD